MELTRYASPLGTIFLAADNGALAGLWLEGQKYFAATLDEAAVERDDLPVFRQAAAWLDAYLPSSLSRICRRWPPRAAISVRRCGGCCWRSPTVR